MLAPVCCLISGVAIDNAETCGALIEDEDEEADNGKGGGVAIFMWVLVDGLSMDPLDTPGTC